MCSSSSSVSSFLSIHLHRRNRLLPSLTDEGVFRPTNPRRRRLSALSASITQNNLELSWVSPDRRDAEDYNGWAIVEEPITPEKRKNGLPTFLLFGIGTSIVVLVAVFAHFSLSRKGYLLRFSSPFHVFVEKNTLGSDDTSKNDGFANEELVESVFEEIDETVEEVIDHIKWEEGKIVRVVISVSADATQQEALTSLKNLKIMEEEVKADELCTRREYARWLVQVNSRLERNPKNRIVPSVALAGSIINAFDDISNQDPDFEYIQALAEAGIVLSKLSGKTLTSEPDNSESFGGVKFYPERFISREDLIGWRAKLEYRITPGLNEEILRNKIGFLDARELESDVLPVLFMDILANEKSITRKAFGQGKRFQPGKPCTKAQAAVALTSGRITEAIRNEFQKLEADNSSRKFAMKEIESELLERGDIKRHWEKKIEDENNRFLVVEAAYREALKDLENEKMDRENGLADYLKEKAALDCQKQLLSRLKEEVDEMNKRLTHERADYVDEQQKIGSVVGESEEKYEKVLDSKSILEAELEALRILRSWIEDEAKKGQARTKVLEEAGRRWKWGSNRS